MPFDSGAKNMMLEALRSEIAEVSLHTGDPGTGAANEVSGGGYSRQAVTFGAAADGKIALSSPVAFSGPADEDATWFAVWDSGGARLGKGQITGDTAFNAAGQFILTTGTELAIED